MLIHTPVTVLMGGFRFDSTSGGSDRRWISFFICPLYIPSEHVWLNWGDRIPGPGPENRISTTLAIEGSDETLQDTFDVMINEGLGGVLSNLSLEGFYQYLQTWNYRGSQVPSFSFEAMAYTAAFLSRENEVNEHLVNCEMSLVIDPHPRGLSDFEEKSLSRVRMVKHLLKEKGLLSVVEQLKEWRNDSVNRFGIQDISMPCN